MTQKLHNSIIMGLWVLVIFAICVWATTGCTPEIQKVYVSPHLTLDPKPVLPTISRDEIPQCQGDDPKGPCIKKETAQKMAIRQHLIIEDDLKCRAAVESLNQPEPPK